MATRRTYPEQEIEILNLAATGTGTSLSVRDYRHIIVEVATSGSANLTIKFQGSIRRTAPTFSSAASATNAWANIESYKYSDTSSAVVGTTGLVFSGTDAVHILEINTNGLAWLNATVTAYSAGRVQVRVLPMND